MPEHIPEQTKALVTGAGGFIGHHLVSYLKSKGYWVRGVDIKRPEFSISDADEFEILDLRRWDNCLQATRGIDETYALAADMGGMGFISAHHGMILFNNKQYADAVKAFVKEQKIAWPVVIDKGDNFQAYGLTAFPYFAVIDRKGIVHNLEVATPDQFAAFRKKVEALAATK